MSENVNFYQGSKKNYNPSEMQGGLYFSKDSKEILLNGESYGNAIEVKDWVNELGFARTSDIPEGLEIGETTGTAFDGGRGKAVEDKVGNLPQYVVTSDRSNPRFVFNKLGNGGLNFNYAYADLSTGDLLSDEISIPTATVNNAGLMSTADKKKLDSLSDSSDVYVVDYLTGNSGTITLELYNELRSAIEGNKTIIVHINDLNFYAQASESSEDRIGMSLSHNIVVDSEVINGIEIYCVNFIIKPDYTYSVLKDSVGFITNGDGTKYLSDDGTYKVIELDDKYLPLSGGNVNGIVTVYRSSGMSYDATTTINDDGVTISGNGGNSKLLVKLGSGLTSISGNEVYFGTTTTPMLYKSIKTAVENPIEQILKITQSAYDELQDKDANTLYIITE